MKRILVFIGLKVVEIGAIIFGPYFLGMLMYQWDWFMTTFGVAHGSYWGIGFLTIILTSVVLLFSSLIIIFFIDNWEWAKRITDKNN